MKATHSCWVNFLFKIDIPDYFILAHTYVHMCMCVFFFDFKLRKDTTRFIFNNRAQSRTNPSTIGNEFCIYPCSARTLKSISITRMKRIRILNSISYRETWCLLEFQLTNLKHCSQVVATTITNLTILSW